MYETMGRAYLLDSEQWEKHDEADDKYDWLMGLAVSRSGVFGPSDVLLQSLTGLRYERDLTSLTAGPYLGYMLSGLQNMAQGMPRTEICPYAIGARNSDKSNTAEHTAAKSFYRLAVAPTLAGVLTMLPMPGGASQLLRGGVMIGATSGSAASSFADAVAGEKKK